MGRFCCLFIMLFIEIGLNAQQLGLVFEDEAYDQLPRLSDANIGAKGILPDEVDLSRYCPFPGDQGAITSCVGWAVGYGALTIEQAVRNGVTDRALITAYAYSPMFIYNQIKIGNCLGGSKVTEALEFLMENGDCQVKDFNVELTNCEAVPGEDAVRVAKNYRIDDYVTLFGTQARPRQKLKMLKSVLAMQKPIVIGMTVKKNFYSLASLNPEEESREVSWWPNIGDTSYAGGHALVLVGYDDDFFDRGSSRKPIEKRGAFKVFNSWGDQWGSDGFAWIRYDYFLEYCKYAFSLSFQGDDPIKLRGKQDEEPQNTIAEASGPRKIQGTFNFKHFTGERDDMGRPLFNSIPVRFNEKYYEALGSWKVGDAFQLEVVTGFDNGYIYVLSVDAEGKAEIHFPRDKRVSERYKDQKESPLLMTSGAKLTIPGEMQALNLAHVGSDYLVVLFSEQKIRIKDLQVLSQQLADKKDQVPYLLDNYPIMIPQEDRQYRSEKMEVMVETESLGKIVPIVLKVETSY